MTLAAATVEGSADKMLCRKYYGNLCTGNTLENSAQEALWKTLWTKCGDCGKLRGKCGKLCEWNVKIVESAAERCGNFRGKLPLYVSPLVCAALTLPQSAAYAADSPP